MPIKQKSANQAMDFTSFMPLSRVLILLNAMIVLAIISMLPIEIKMTFRSERNNWKFLDTGK